MLPPWFTEDISLRRGQNSTTNFIKEYIQEYLPLLVEETYQFANL